MIELQCECGTKYSVQDDMQGKRMRCPKCSAILTVPESADAIADAPAIETDLDSLASLDVDAPPSDTPQPAKKSSRRRRGKSLLGGLSGNLLDRELGTKCLLIGFLMIVGARGCSQTSILNLTLFLDQLSTEHG